MFQVGHTYHHQEFVVVENENCYPMVSPGGTNAAMTGITYQSDELEILQRYTETDSNLDEFLSIKTEESKAAEIPFFVQELFLS